MDLKSLVLVFLGGGIGSSIRFLITKYFNKISTIFPIGTSISNILGCFVIGILIAFFNNHDIHKKDIFLFMSVGICGGLTTFSTLMLDIYNMYKCENLQYMLAYFSINFILGFFFIFFGFLIFK